MKTNEGAVDFGDESVTSNYKDFSKEDFRRFRGKIDYVYRIFFFQEAIMRRWGHTFNKQTRRCLAYAGFCPACESPAVKPPKEVYGANVFIYPTNKDGDIVDFGKEEHIKSDIYMWRFGPDKYIDLRAVVKEWGPLQKRDLKLTIKDETFQKFSITPCNESLCLTNDVFRQFLAKLVKTNCYPLDKVTVKELSPLKMIEEWDLDKGLIPKAKLIDVQKMAVDKKPQEQEKKKEEPKKEEPIKKETPVQTVLMEFFVAEGKDVKKCGREEIQKLLDSGKKVKVMSEDQESGWKDPVFFGFSPNVVSAPVPPPPVMEPQKELEVKGKPSAPLSKDFDDMFAKL